MYENVSECVVTIKPESLEVGINEIYLIDNKAKVTNWIDKGIAVVKLSKGFDFLAQNLIQKPPVFVQHVFPLHRTLELLISPQKSDDLEICNNSDRPKLTAIASSLNKILVEAGDVLALLNIHKTFSVQARVFGEMEKDFRRQDFEEMFSNYLKSKGFTLEVQNPSEVVSIAVANNKCYIGVSHINDNLSAWSGGAHRFLKEKEQVCRAEFKLLEALDYYKIDMSGFIKAIDLGAAPGGWTRVLLNKGLGVYAVDPANLDESLGSEKKLQHFKETAQEFFKRDFPPEFDMIVNDMKMDTKESAKLMVESSRLLKENGLGVITLKLPKIEMKRKIKDAVKILESCYAIIGVRQLFHNRSEVTVIIRKN